MCRKIVENCGESSRKLGAEGCSIPFVALEKRFVAPTPRLDKMPGNVKNVKEKRNKKGFYTRSGENISKMDSAHACLTTHVSYKLKRHIKSVHEKQ